MDIIDYQDTYLVSGKGQSLIRIYYLTLIRNSVCLNLIDKASSSLIQFDFYRRD